MKMRTDLISGAGNTFHITLGSGSLFTNQPDPNAKMKQVAMQICSQHKADGFIFLETDEVAAPEKAMNFKWTFFNNDGSDAEMCGNATRCIGFFLRNKLFNVLPYWKLQTKAGPIQIEPAGPQKFKVIMSPLKKMQSELGFFCDTGVPHLVLETKDSSILSPSGELKDACAKLRFHSDFQPRGTNVTYVYFENEKSKIKAVSYERGVEDFTLACGTGAMAAAFFNLTKRGITETQVEMPGGTLMMNLQDLEHPAMTGPAELLGSYDNEI